MKAQLGTFQTADMYIIIETLCFMDVTLNLPIDGALKEKICKYVMKEYAQPFLIRSTLSLLNRPLPPSLDAYSDITKQAQLIYQLNSETQPMVLQLFELSHKKDLSLFMEEAKALESHLLLSWDEKEAEYVRS